MMPTMAGDSRGGRAEGQSGSQRGKIHHISTTTSFSADLSTLLSFPSPLSTSSPFISSLSKRHYFLLFLAPFFMYGIPSNLIGDIFTPIFQQSAFHHVEYCFLDHILALTEAMLFVVLIMLHRRVMSSQSRPQHCNCDIYRSPSYKSDLHQYP